MIYNKLEKLLNRVQYHEQVLDEIMELVVTPEIGLQFVKLLEKNLDMMITFQLHFYENMKWRKMDNKMQKLIDALSEQVTKSDMIASEQLAKISSTIAKCRNDQRQGGR